MSNNTRGVKLAGLPEALIAGIKTNRIYAFTHRFGPRAVLFAAIQFFILTFLAMEFYPGGTLFDPNATRYLFFENFLSDLGRTQVYNGAPNPVSFFLWATALILVGLGLILFFLALPHYFSGRWPEAFCYLGTFFGVLSGISFLGIAFSPANLLNNAHRFFGYGAFIFFLVAILLYIISILLNAQYPNRYAGVYMIFAAFLTIFLYLLFSTDPATGDDRVVQVTAQKIIVYSAMVVTIIQVYGLEKMREPEKELIPV